MDGHVPSFVYKCPTGRRVVRELVREPSRGPTRPVSPHASTDLPEDPELSSIDGSSPPFAAYNPRDETSRRLLNTTRMMEMYPRVRRRAALAATVLICGVLAGCAIVDNLDEEVGGVQVRTTGVDVVIQNGLNEYIYYFIVGRQLSFLIDWIPHLDDERSVAPGRTKSVPYDEILMSQDPSETQVVVYWWQATLRDGKRVPGTLEMVVLDL